MTNESDENLRRAGKGLEYLTGKQAKTILENWEKFGLKPPDTNKNPDLDTRISELWFLFCFFKGENRIFLPFRTAKSPVGVISGWAFVLSGLLVSKAIVTLMGVSFFLWVIVRLMRLSLYYALTFNTRLRLTTIDKAAVHKDGRITFRFISGMEIST